MSFLKPLYLYLLFLIPLLLFLYMLRLKRKTQVVSSIILWEQAIEDIKANTPFQRLRRNILLPLQVLFLMLIIFALARPFWRMEAETARNVILVIDESASMKAHDIDGSRFAAAKSAATEIIEKSRKMMIIEAGSSPKIATGFTSDKPELRKAIDKAVATDTPTHLESAIQLASSIASDASGSQIILLSDGAVKMPQEFNQAISAIQFVKFGKKDSDNVGITAFEVARSPSESSKIQVFAALQNFGSKEKEISIEFYQNKNLIDVRELSLAPEERRSVLFNGIDYAEGILKVTIDVEDQLITDNSAYYVLREDKPSKVLLVSRGNLFLQEAVKASSTKLEFTYQQEYSVDKDYDLIIFDSFIPDEFPDENIMLANPLANLPFGKFLSKVDNPKIIDWDRDNPVMRFVDLSNLIIDRCLNYEMPTWMKPLIESDAGTLMWMGENDGQRIVILPFEIRPGISNNFPMLPAFPIFMANAVNWLLGFEDGYSQRQVKAGQPLKMNIPEALSGQKITVKKPDNQEVEFQLEDRTFVFDDTDEIGIYSIIGNGFSESFAVNLLDESESNIEPNEKLQFANQEIKSSPVSVTNTQEIWSILVMIALVLLAIEWWAYHRRVLV